MTQHRGLSAYFSYLCRKCLAACTRQGNTLRYHQTKELSYTVEYYKDGKKVENDTQVVKQTKQVLESDTLTVEKGKKRNIRNTKR